MLHLTSLAQIILKTKLSQLWLNISHAQKQGLEWDAVSKITAYYGENLTRVFKLPKVKTAPLQSSWACCWVASSLNVVVSQEVRWEAGVEGSSLQLPAAAPDLRHDAIRCRSGSVPVCGFAGGALGPQIQHCKRARQPLGKKEIVVEKACYNSRRQQAALNWHGSYIIKATYSFNTFPSTIAGNYKAQLCSTTHHRTAKWIPIDLTLAN